MKNEKEFSNSEYLEQIREAEEKLENTRTASIQYLEQLAKYEREVNRRFKINTHKERATKKSIRKNKISKPGRKSKKKQKRFQCDQCHFKSDSPNKFVTHKCVHTGEKPLKCDQCDYSCSASSNLTRHRRIHTGERPYKCDQCEYSSADSSSLAKHKRTHTGAKPFKCDQCEYTVPANRSKYSR